MHAQRRYIPAVFFAKKRMSTAQTGLRLAMVKCHLLQSAAASLIFSCHYIILEICGPIVPFRPAIGDTTGRLGTHTDEAAGFSMDLIDYSLYQSDYHQFLSPNSARSPVDTIGDIRSRTPLSALSHFLSTVITPYLWVIGKGEMTGCWNMQRQLSVGAVVW